MMPRFALLAESSFALQRFQSGVAAAPRKVFVFFTVASCENPSAVIKVRCCGMGTQIRAAALRWSCHAVSSVHDLGSSSPCGPWL